MKFLYLIILIIFNSFNSFSNELEVIDLHENKSLDQMVLDKANENTQDIIESNNISENEDLENGINEDNIVSQDNIDQDGSQITINLSNINKYLKNSQNINSKVLQKEFSYFLENLNLDLALKENRQIYFSITDYFYRVGDLSKAYNFSNIIPTADDENENFYNMIKFNYLLSTFQLEEVCNLKNNIVPEIKLKNFLTEKVDIFCLILNENFSEAELLNSILIDSQVETDNYFQELYNLLINKNKSSDILEIKFDKSINKDLIFLYSAMLRIAELPLNRDFLEVDPKNLAIPIILNRSTPIELRLKAANESYINNNISIESLAALYQSVDFNSEQLNNPEATIKKLDNEKEILMAYYFQLINIQIFPSERLEAIINFWNFAKLNNLEDIAYSLTYKTIQSVQITAENLKYSTHIATSYIYNKDYDNALNWIEFYENVNGNDERSIYARILLSLYSAEELSSVVEIITNNYDNFDNDNKLKNEELIFTLLDILESKDEVMLTEDFTNIYDERLMPSIFITNNLNKANKNKDYQNLLIYSIISLNDRQWNDIHPEHLKLILIGFIDYGNSEIAKEIVIEIFKNYKIL